MISDMINEFNKSSGKVSTVIFLVMLFMALWTVGGSLNADNLFQVVITIGMYYYILKFSLSAIRKVRKLIDE